MLWDEDIENTVRYQTLSWKKAKWQKRQVIDDCICKLRSEWVLSVKQKALTCTGAT